MSIMSREAVINPQGLHLMSLNPQTMVETSDGAGLSMAYGTLRLANSHTPNINLGDMADFRHANGHTTLDLNNMKSISLNGYNIPVSENLVRTARPEVLVTPLSEKQTKDLERNKSNQFAILDVNARALYIAPEDRKVRQAPQTYITGSCLQIAGGPENAKRNMQVSPTTFELNNTWSMSSSKDDVFTIGNTNKQKSNKEPNRGHSYAPLRANLDEVWIGLLPGKNPISVLPNTLINNTLQTTKSISTPHMTNDPHGNTEYGMRYDGMTAAQTLSIGSSPSTSINFHRNQMYVGVDPMHKGANHVNQTARLVLAKEMQIGPKYKIVDTNESLALVDVTTNKTIRTLAHLVAPPPMVICANPYTPVQQLSNAMNAKNERAITIDLKQMFQSMDDSTGTNPGTGSLSLSYSLILNPDNMGQIDPKTHTLRLQTRINSATSISTPILRIGTVQVRAISAFGALSIPVVIPFEERFYLPPLPLPVTNTHKIPLILEEGQRIPLNLHTYFANPNPEPLTTVERQIMDEESRKGWTFRVNGNSGSANPIAVLESSNKNTQFTVTIVAVNEFGFASTAVEIPVQEIYISPPIQIKDLPPFITASDEDIVTLNLAEYFQDPQNFKLIYEVAAMLPARININNGVLTIQAQNRNISYPLQIQVTNKNKDKRVKTLQAKSEVQMRETYIPAPVVASDANGMPIKFASKEIGDDTTVSIDLSVRATDSRQLTYTIVSNLTNANANIRGRQLFVKGNNRNTGVYTIDVKADNGGKSVVFQVELEEIIWPTPGLANV